MKPTINQAIAAQTGGQSEEIINAVIGKRTLLNDLGASRPASINEDATEAAIEARAPLTNKPIGNCPHCGTPVYTDVGFCGGCRP